MTVSYSAEEIGRVFGIPNRGQEVEKISMTVADKKKWLKLMCQKDLTSLEWEGILKNSRGLKKIFIANGEWRCVVDLVKSKLTTDSRTSDIALWMLPIVDGLYKGQTYNWAKFLSDRLREFMELKHKAFYVPHHTVALFLEAVRTQVSSEHRGTLVPTSRVELYKPAMTYWLHLDTLDAGSHNGGEPKKKKPKQTIVIEEVEEEDDESSEEGSYMDSSSSDSQEAEICLSHL